MKVAFRVDASLHIGNGHVMRCLTLADHLRQHGIESRFLCREHTGNLISHITAKGYVVHVLPMGTNMLDQHSTAHATWLGATQAQDASASASLLQEWMPDCIIVDHYGLDIYWHRKIRRFCKKLMIIDDLADRHYDCDLLLDQNLGRSVADYFGRVPAYCKVLAGSTYALLRPEFLQLRDYSLQRRNNASPSNLLISMGGVDKPNATYKILSVLQAYPLPEDFRISVVMGGNAPKLEQVQTMAQMMRCPTEVLVDITDMAQRLADCDLSIGAAGSTSWERCCLGVPSIVIILAENQRHAAQALYDVGAVLLADFTDSEIAFKKILRNFFIHNDYLHHLSNAAAAVCDGNGVVRVGEEIAG